MTDLIGLFLGVAVLLVLTGEQFQRLVEESEHVRSDSPQGLCVRDDRGATQDDLPGVLYLDGQCLAGRGQHECDRSGFLQIDTLVQLVNRIEGGYRFLMSVQVIECVIADEGYSRLVRMDDVGGSFL